MANLIKKIKIKKEDGTYTDYIPIGAEARNISLSYNNSNVDTTLRKKPYYYNCVNKMQLDDTLREGDMCEVLGFERPDDLGAGLFYITKEPLKSVTYTLTLSNNLIANLIEDKSKVKYSFPKRFSDVPQNNGEACLIQAFGKNILIDSYFAIYKESVYEFLNRHGVTHLDVYVNSHYHNDHAGNNGNLIRDGYIDKNTKIYLPPYTRLIGSSGQMYDYYIGTTNVMQEYGLTATPMIEGEIAFSFGYNFTGTFYNCSTEIYDTEMQYTDYNNCSLILHLNHNGITSLYGGDCLRLDRLITNNLLTSHLNFLKISHHGFGASPIAANILYNRIARPDYAIQCAGVSAGAMSNNATSVENKFLSDIGTKIYATYDQDEDIVFESYKKEFYCTNGKPLFGTGLKTASVSYYVDSTYINNDRNGTQEKPFKNLIEAIAACDSHTDSPYHIYILNYDNPPTQSASYQLGAPKNIIYIHGLDDNTSIVVPEYFYFRFGNGSGKYIFENITFDWSNTMSGSMFSISDRSNIEFNNCRFINSGNLKSGAIIWTNGDSLVSCDSCYFGEGFNIGISLHENGQTKVKKCTFNVNQYPIQLDTAERASVIETDNTYLKRYSHIVNHNDYCSLNAGLGPQLIWKGSTKDTTQTYTTDFPLTDASMLLVETGIVGSGTSKVDIVKGLWNGKIIAGSYYVNTCEPLLRIRLTIISNYSFSFEYIDDRGLTNPSYNDYTLRGISVLNYGTSTITYNVN